jgi:hypothetical protein
LRTVLILSIFSLENDYQYEYRQPDAPRYQDSDPAVALAAISESAEALEPSQDDAQESSYTLVSPQAGVDNLTLALNRTTLSSVNQKQTPAPAAQNPVNYNQVRERSNSFSAGMSSCPLCFHEITAIQRSLSNSTTFF